MGAGLLTRRKRLCYFPQPFSRSAYSGIAQLVEQRTVNPRVVGSSPTAGANSRTSRYTPSAVALYWKPLYKYLRVVQGRSKSDAEFLTRGFLKYAPNATRTNARHLLDSYVLSDHTRAVRGEQFDTSEAEREIAHEVRTVLSADEYLNREWSKNLFSIAVERLRESSRAGDFALFETYDLTDIRSMSYRSLGEHLNDLSESRLAKIRRQFRQILLQVLRESVESDDEYRSEARALLGIEA